MPQLVAGDTPVGVYGAQAGHVNNVHLICQYLLFRSESLYSSFYNVFIIYSCVDDLLRLKNSILQSVLILKFIEIIATSSFIVGQPFCIAITIFNRLQPKERDKTLWEEVKHENHAILGLTLQVLKLLNTYIYMSCEPSLISQQCALSELA